MCGTERELKRGGRKREKRVKAGTTQGELYRTFSFRNQSNINKLKAYGPYYSL